MPIVKFDSNFIKLHLQCPAGRRKIEYCSADIPGLLVWQCQFADSVDPSRHPRKGALGSVIGMAITSTV